MKTKISAYHQSPRLQPSQRFIIGKTRSETKTHARHVRRCLFRATGSGVRRSVCRSDVSDSDVRKLDRGVRRVGWYNFPTCDQVAAVIDGDGGIGSLNRDIILRRVSGKLRRISELNTNYFSLRYPIFFMFGSHGWDEHYRNMHSRRTFDTLNPDSLPFTNSFHFRSQQESFKS